MATSPRVVCWQDREEWLQIYKYLYSFEEPVWQKKGVYRIEAWRSRSGGKLPIAVECTGHLISAYLADTTAHSDPRETRLILSMALVRFVNGMADSSQKGLYARSVQSIAEEIGLPDWLVDMRHEATHAGLPSLETLRAGLGVALNWLKDEYWEAQVIIHRESEQNLIKWLNTYKNKQIEYLACKKKHKKAAKDEISKLVQDIVTVTITNELWFEVLRQLLTENMLLRSAQTCHTLGIDNPVVTNDTQEVIPKKVVLIWKPLLEALDRASSEFIPSLIAAIFDELGFENGTNYVSKAFSSALLSWLHYLVDSCSCKGKKDKYKLVLNCDMSWSTLLETCLKQPCKETLFLALTILPNLNSPNSVKQKIKNLIQICVQEPISHETENNNDVPVRETSDILKTLLRDMKVKQNASSSVTIANESRQWTLAEGPTQWHLIPLGEVLGVSIDNGNLDLEENSRSSCNCMDRNTSQTDVDRLGEMDQISDTTESEEATQYFSTELAEDSDMIVDTTLNEFDSSCDEPNFESKTEIQHIQDAVYLF